jgi:hypothetical protein
MTTQRHSLKESNNKVRRSQYSKSGSMQMGLAFCVLGERVALQLGRCWLQMWVVFITILHDKAAGACRMCSRGSVVGGHGGFGACRMWQWNTMRI